MKKIYSCILLGFVSLQVTTAQASEVKVEWIEPDTFRDIRAGDISQKRFEAKVLQELGSQFRESAQYHLAENQTLHLQITDVDLAGRVDYFFRHHTPIRVIRSIDFPSISFSYKVKNENNIIVASGKERIKDMGFNFSTYSYSHLRSDALYYEKELIEDWFKKTF